MTSLTCRPLTPWCNYSPTKNPRDPLILRNRILGAASKEIIRNVNIYVLIFVFSSNFWPCSFFSFSSEERIRKQNDFYRDQSTNYKHHCNFAFLMKTKKLFFQYVKKVGIILKFRTWEPWVNKYRSKLYNWWSSQIF